MELTYELTPIPVFGQLRQLVIDKGSVFKTKLVDQGRLSRRNMDISLSEPLKESPHIYKSTLYVTGMSSMKRLENQKILGTIFAEVAREQAQAISDKYGLVDVNMKHVELITKKTSTTILDTALLKQNNKKFHIETIIMDCITSECLGNSLTVVSKYIPKDKVVAQTTTQFSFDAS